MRQEATTYAKHYMNQFDQFCWEGIAQVAESSPSGARGLTVLKAMAEIFQELIINPLELIEEAVRTPCGDGRVINVLKYAGFILISPLTVIVKIIHIFYEAFSDPTFYPKIWAKNYAEEMTKFENRGLDRIATETFNKLNFASDLAQKYINDNGHTDDPIAQKIIKDNFTDLVEGHKEFPALFSSPSEVLEKMQNYLSSEDEKTELRQEIATQRQRVESKKDEQPFKEFTDKVDLFFKSYRQKNNVKTRFSSDCVQFERNLLISTAKENKDCRPTILKNIQTGEIELELNKKINAKTEKYAFISKMYKEQREGIRQKTLQKLMDTEEKDALKYAEESNEHFFDRQGFRFDSTSFELNMLNEMAKDFRSRLISCSRLDQIGFEKDSDEIVIGYLIAALDLNSYKTAARILLNKLLVEKGSREETINYFINSETSDFKKTVTNFNLVALVKCGEKLSMNMSNEERNKIKNEILLELQEMTPEELEKAAEIARSSKVRWSIG